MALGRLKAAIAFVEKGWPRCPVIASLPAPKARSGRPCPSPFRRFANLRLGAAAAVRPEPMVYNGRDGRASALPDAADPNTEGTPI